MGLADGMVVLLIIVSLIGTCVIAWLASGQDRRVSPLWGLLGPVGWVIAALRGMQEGSRRTRRTLEDLTATLMHRAPQSASEGDSTDRHGQLERAAVSQVQLVRASHTVLGMLSSDWHRLPAVTRFRRAIAACGDSWNRETATELRETAETMVRALRAPGSPYEASSRLAALQRALQEPDPELE